MLEFLLSQGKHAANGMANRDKVLRSFTACLDKAKMLW